MIVRLTQLRVKNVLNVRIAYAERTLRTCAHLSNEPEISILMLQFINLLII